MYSQINADYFCEIGVLIGEYLLEKSIGGATPEDWSE